MKRIVVVVCVAACFLACKKEPSKKPIDPPEPPAKTDLTIVAQVSDNESRTQHSDAESGLKLSWAASDNIGVYVTAEEESYASNVAYKADEASAKSGFTAVGEKAEWKDEVLMHSFYAYYPYAQEAGTKYSEVAVTLPALQTQSAAGSTQHLAALDFMYAAKEKTTRPEDGSVELAFKHAFSVLGLSLTATEGTTVTIDGIVLRNSNQNGILAAEDAVINLATGKLDYSAAKTSKEIELTFAQPLALTEESVDRAYMQIIPGHAGTQLDIIALVDGEEKLLVTKAIPAAGLPAGVIANVALSVQGEGDDPRPEDPIAVEIIAPEDDAEQLKDLDRWNGWE